MRNAVLARGRVDADADDQRRHQRERHPAAEPARRSAGPPRAGSCRSPSSGTACSSLEPTMASTIRRSPSSRRWISSTILPARHHDDAVAEPRQLERIARLDDDRDAVVRLPPQRVVDVEAGSDVDALGRLVGEDHADVSAQERASERDLLLIAAGERLHGLLDRRESGSSGGATMSSTRALALARRFSKPQAAAAPSTWIVVFARTLRTGKSDSPSPVAAQQHDSRAERGRAETSCRARVPLQAALPVRALGAGESPQELDLAVALGAGDPEDLALVQRRGRSARIGRRAARRRASSTSLRRRRRVARERRAGAAGRSSARRGLLGHRRPPRTSPGRRRRGGQ